MYLIFLLPFETLLNEIRAVCFLETCAADNPSAPEGGVSFAQLQQVGLHLLCVVWETLGEGANQTRRAAFVFQQLNALPWKPHAVNQLSATNELVAEAQLRTADSGVGLDKHFASLLPQQHGLTQSQEAVRAGVADGGITFVKSPASVHISC